MTSIYIKYPTDPVNNLPIGLDGFRRIDLFEDENMEFISKVNDITKLDKVFSDFSNSFTVPATANNNEIFRFYYDIDVELEYVYNPNIRIDCYVEIDTVAYRYATVQLESVKTKEGRVDSYSIGIFSSITQLTDLFGEDKLSDLDFPINSLEPRPNGLAMYNYENNSANFYTSIKDQSFQNGSIITPMINISDKHWKITGATNANSRNITGTHVETANPENNDPFSSRDTRPSFAIIRIIEAIEKKYHVKFSRDFFGRAEFLNLFMWLNRKENSTLGEENHIQITEPLTLVTPPACPTCTGDGSNIISTVDGDIQITFRDNYYTAGNTRNEGISFITYTLTPQAGYTGINYVAKAYDTITGQQIGFPGTGPGTSETGPGNKVVRAVLRARVNSNTPLSRTAIFSLKIQSDAPILFDIDVEAVSGHEIRVPGSNPSTIRESEKESNNNLKSSLGIINIADNIPEMKVVEFMQNIMKMFKLVIRPQRFSPAIFDEKNGNFLITTLNSFYLKGEQKDITQFIDFKETNIRKPDIYKELLFSYEATKNILGETYKKNNIEGIGYGDLKITFPESQVNTKNKLEVKIGWENMLFERLNNANVEQTDLMIGESIATTDGGKTFSPNKSKALVFYNIGLYSLYNIPAKIKAIFGNDAPVSLPYVSIMNASNDGLINQVTQSINFNPGSIDPWHLVPIPQSLFETKWRNWVDEIYDFRQRKFAFKAVALDQKTITSLDLADTVVIKDNIYKIDDMKINLSTGDATFNLFRTFRPFEIPTFFNPVNFGTPLTRSGDPLFFTDYVEDGEKVTLLGSFTEVGGESHNHLVRLDAQGNIDNTFNTGTGLEGGQANETKKMIRVGDYLYITGAFNTYNGVLSRWITKINYYTGEIDGTFANNVRDNFNDFIYTITDTGDGLVVGGEFTDFGGTPLTYLTKLNYDGTLWDLISPGDYFAPPLDGVVTGVINIPSPLTPETFIQIAVGSFTTYYGNIVNGIVGFDSSAPQPNYGSYGTLVSPTGNVQIEKATDDPNDSSFWVFGDITDFNGTPVNNIALVDASTGEVLPATIPSGGPDGQITFGKRVLGDKLLIQGETLGFARYDGIATKSVIITTEGQIYQTFPGTNNFVYNVGNTFYSVDLDTNETTGIVLDDTTPILNRQLINATAGQMYYDITIQQKISWLAEKVDTGFGTTWIKFVSNKTNLGELDITTGEGLDTCTFLVKAKALPPDSGAYTNRTMKIKITFSDGSISVVDIIQTGLTNIP